MSMSSPLPWRNLRRGAGLALTGVMLAAVFGAGGPVPQTAAADPCVQPVPRHVVATPGNSVIAVTWDEPAASTCSVSEPASYFVQYRGQSGDWVEVRPEVRSLRLATLTDLSNGETYSIRVASTSSENRVWSDIVTATPLASRPSLPAAPTGLAATYPDGADDRGQIVASWNPVSAGNLVGYVVETTYDGHIIRRQTAETETSMAGWGLIWNYWGSFFYYNWEGPSVAKPGTFRVAALTSVGLGPWSTAVSVTEDPTVRASDLILDHNTIAGVRPYLSGWFDATGTVKVTTADGREVCTVEPRFRTTWSCELPEWLPEGESTLTVTGTKADGTTQVKTCTVDLDRTPPPPPTITSPAAGSTIGLRPTFSGQAEANSEVNVYQVNSATSNTFACSATAGTTGRWSCTSEYDLVPGAATIRVEAYDAHYNPSAPTDYSYTIDPGTDPFAAILAELLTWLKTFLIELLTILTGVI